MERADRPQDPDASQAHQTGFSEVASEVRALLASAERAASEIREKAERDAGERRTVALAELSRLRQLAADLSAQAAAVRQQCDALDRALHDEGRMLPADHDEPFSRTRARIDAHRMKLAGADAGEVASYLERRGIDDPEGVVRQVFARDQPQREGPQ